LFQFGIDRSQSLCTRLASLAHFMCSTHYFLSSRGLRAEDST
jgi:hypothetical protein